MRQGLDEGYTFEAAPDGVTGLQRLVAGAIVITNSHFTSKARVLDEANEVVVWDRARLIKGVLTAQPTNIVQQG